jgi:hypothetical protein
MATIDPIALAHTLEQLAHSQAQPHHASILRLAAAQLRNDPDLDQHLSQLLAQLPAEQLIGIAAIALEQQAAAGDPSAAKAAAHLNLAGLLLLG